MLIRNGQCFLHRAAGVFQFAEKQLIGPQIIQIRNGDVRHRDLLFQLLSFVQEEFGFLSAAISQAQGGKDCKIVSGLYFSAFRVLDDKLGTEPGPVKCRFTLPPGIHGDGQISISCRFLINGGILRIQHYPEHQFCQLCAKLLIDSEAEVQES